MLGSCNAINPTLAKIAPFGGQRIDFKEDNITYSHGYCVTAGDIRFFPDKDLFLSPKTNHQRAARICDSFNGIRNMQMSQPCQML